MKSLLFILFLIVCSNASIGQTISHSAKDDYISNKLIIKVNPLYKSICENNSINNPLFNSYFLAIGGSNLQKKFPLNSSPKELVNTAGQYYADLSTIYELTFSNNTAVEKVIDKLMASKILIYAEPHYIPKSLYLPNDPLGNPTNQSFLQTINAFNAWNINKGDSSIIIGVTDTGTEPTHTDLSNNIARNYNDIIDGFDNDGDGFIDNYKGWDIGMNDNDPTYQANAHGVHVCGISSASADNNIGGTGVGFNCKLLPVKISDATGNLIAAYEGIKYAADHGCSIINCSWGGGSVTQFGQDIITYATINKNCLVVAAAGNNGQDGEFFPAAYNYVMAVANTTNNDIKHSTSNYGYFVDVSAPGEGIRSTWIGNSFTQLTGTSMSSPVVAGAAGIVKTYFPTYNGLQVCERLKVTSDNIYFSNPTFNNKLGTGRVNLFRALTDPPSPSVVLLNKSVTDKNDEVYINSDTLFIAGIFVNYLNPTVALNVTVTPLSSLVTIIDNTTSFGIINTMASKTNSLDPFTFKLTGVIPINQPIDFEVIISDGSYYSKQYFTLNVNLDYINIVKNDLRTTVTSKGKLGFNKYGQVEGLGFEYKGLDLLYESGLMIGIDSNRVSDCARNSTGTNSDFDFSVISRVIKQTPAIFSDFETNAILNDNLAPIPMNIEINQNTYSWNTIPNNKFVIWEYIIKNKNVADTLKNMFVGIFADWDVDGSSYTQNRSNYDATTKMGYSYFSGINGKYAGIKLLTDSVMPNFYAIDNFIGGAGGIDAVNGINTKNKYKLLSTPRYTAGNAGVGTDVINVMSAGPFLVIPNKSVRVAFALIAGDSLDDVKATSNLAQVKYNSTIPTPTTNVGLSEINNDEFLLLYPNPTSNILNVNQANFEYSILEIYSLTGSLILKTDLTKASETIDLSRQSKGLYIVKMVSPKKTIYKKIILTD